jgi:carbonic anhydrase
MRKLVQGIHHHHDHIVAARKSFFSELARGQAPRALFITCSDSRISPNEITQTQPGELFVIRNAGNIVPPHGPFVGGEDATIEYAVAALGVPHIIICGHTHCGAMKGVLHPEQLTTLPGVAAWLSNAEATRRIVRENYPADLGEEALLDAAICENVLVQIEHVQTLPVVAAALARGTLDLHAWVYKIETGDVLAYDRERGEYLPLGDDEPRPFVARTRGWVPATAGGRP